MVIVNLTPQSNEDQKSELSIQQNKDVLHNQSSRHGNFKSIDLIEEILNENNLNKNSDFASFNLNKSFNSSKHKLNANPNENEQAQQQQQQQQQQQHQHVLDQTPVSTSSKSKIERSSSNNNIIDVNNNHNSNDILNQKASSYYDDVKNKEMSDTSNIRQYVCEASHSQQRKGLRVTRLDGNHEQDEIETRRNRDTVIQMNGVEECVKEAESCELTKQQAAMHMRLNQAYEIEVENESLKNSSCANSRKHFETFYDGSKVWTAVTDAEYSIRYN